MTSSRVLHPVLISSIAALLAPLAAHAQSPFTWDGGGDPDPLWSNAANWDTGVPDGNDILNFAGTLNLLTNNDLAGYNGHRILFNTGAGAFTLGGNAVTLFDFGGAAPRIENNSTNLQTISLPLSLDHNGGQAEIAATSGALSITAAVTLLDNSGMTTSGANAISFAAGLTGAGTGKLIVGGGGSVSLGGTSNYTGNTEVDFGTLSIGGSIASGSAIFVGNGGQTGSAATLLLSNATGGQTQTNALQVNPGSGINRTIGGTNTSGTNTFSGTLALQNGVSLTAAAGGEVAFSGIISGAHTVDVIGGGKVTLSGVNTFTGAISVTGGSTLSANVTQLNNVDAASPLGGTGARAITISGGSTFNLTGGTLNPVASTKTFVAGAGGATFDIASGATLQLDDASQFSGTGAVVKNGAGTMLLGNDYNAWTGGSIALNAGMLTLSGNANAAGNAANKAVINAAAGTILQARASGATAVAFANNVVSAGNLTLQSGSTAANAGSTQTLGTLSIGGASPTIIVQNGANINANSAGSIRFGAATVTGTGAPTFDIRNNGTGLNILFLASLNEGAATRAFQKIGTGTLRVDTPSTLTSGSSFTVTAGKIESGSSGAYGAAAVTLSGGNFDARHGTGQIGAFANSVTLTANATVNSGANTSAPGAQHTMGALSLGTNTYTLAASNLVTNTAYGMSHASTTLTGNPTFNPGNNGTATGTLALGAINDGGVARTIVKTGAGNLYVNATPTALAGATFNVNQGGLVANIAGSLTDSTINLGDTTGTNTAGVFVDAAGGVFDRAITVRAGSTGAATIGGLNTTGTSTVSGNITLLKGVSVSALAGGTVEISGVIDDGAGTFGVTKVGDGLVILSGANTYNGTTTISAGALQFGSFAAIPAGVVVNAPGALTTPAGYAIDQAFLGQITTGSTGTAALGADSANALDFSTFAALRLGATGTRNYTGTITPSGATYRLGGGTGTLILPNVNALTGANALDVQGTGVVSLTTTNDFTGATTVSSGGTLRLTAQSNIGSSSGLTLNGGTLQFGAAFDPTAGTPALTIGASGAGFDTNGFDVTFANALAGGAGPVAKVGAGTLTLSAASTYTGLTSLNGGFLAVADVAFLGTTSSLVGNGGAFRYTGATNATLAKPITIAAQSGLTVKVDTAGTELLIGSAAASAITGGSAGFTGLTVQGPGTTVIQNGIPTTNTVPDNTFAGDILINNGGILEIRTETPGDASTLDSNAEAGVGANNKLITIDGGTLRVSGAANWNPASATSFFVIGAGGGTIDITTGRTLQLDDGNAINGPGYGAGAQQIQGSGALTKTGAGTLQLGGTTAGNFSGFTGTILVSGGTLLANNPDSTTNRFVLGSASAATTISTGGTVDVRGLSSESVVLTGGSLLNTTGSALLTGPINFTSDSSFGGNGTMTLTPATGADGFAGAAKATKVGTGATILTGASPNFTGTVEVSAGTLRYSHVDPLANASAVTVLTGGRIDTGVADVNLEDVAVNVGGFLRLSNPMDTANGAKVPTTPISGALELNNTAIGANFDGIQIAAGGGILAPLAGVTFASDITLNGAVNLDFAGNNAYTLSGVLSGAGGLNRTSTNAGDVTLGGTAANTFGGLVQWNRGTLTLAKPAGVNAIAGSGLAIASVANGGTRVLLNANEQLPDAMPVTISAAATLAARLSLNNTTETVGTVTMSTVTIGDGTVGAALVQTGATGTLVLNGDLVLQPNRNSTGNNIRSVLVTGSGQLNTATTDGTLNLNSATRGISVSTAVTGGNAASNDAVIETVITNGGIVKKTGIGGLQVADRTLYLTNSGNTYAGGTRIEAGIVRATGAAAATSGALGSGAVTLAGGNLTVANDGAAVGGTVTYGNDVTFDLTTAAGTVDGVTPTAARNITFQLGKLTMNGSVAQTLTTTASAGASTQFTSAEFANNPTISAGITTRILGAITGTGGFTKAGTGGLTIGNPAATETTPNTYTGTVTVNAGTLSVNKAAGVTAITGDLVQTGGTVTQVNDDQYADTASISVSGGTFNFGNGTVGADETVATLNTTGGTVNFNNQTAPDITTVNVGTVNLSGGSTILGSNGTELIVGAGGLNLTHSGTTLLTFNQGASGATANKLVLNGDVTYLAGASTATTATNIAYGAANPVIGSLDLGSATRTFNVADNTFAATDLVVSVNLANGSLLKTGAGFMTVSSPIPASVSNVAVSGGVLNLSSATGNVHAGGTTVNTGGTLETRANATGNNLGTGTLTLNGGTFSPRYNASGTPSILLNANSPVLVTADSAITVANNGSNSGHTLQMMTLGIGAQTLSVSGANNFGLLFAGATTLSGNATFAVADTGGANDDLTLSTVGEDAAGRSLTKTGAGVLAITGAAGHTGATNIDGGTLEVGPSGSLSGSTLIDVASGATFDVSALGGGFVAGAAQTLVADGTVTGSLDIDGTLLGSGSVSGAVNVDGTLAPGGSPGVLDLGSSLTLGATSVFALEGDGPAPGDGAGFYDQVNVAGNISLTSGATVTLTLGGGAVVGDVLYGLTTAGTFTGTFANAAEGATVDFGGGVTGLTTYLANWNVNQAGSTFSGGNDFAIQLVTVPEPGSALALLAGLGALAGLRRFRRRA